MLRSADRRPGYSDVTEQPVDACAVFGGYQQTRDLTISTECRSRTLRTMLQPSGARSCARPKRSSGSFAPCRVTCAPWACRREVTAFPRDQEPTNTRHKAPLQHGMVAAATDKSCSGESVSPQGTRHSNGSASTEPSWNKNSGRALATALWRCPAVSSRRSAAELRHRVGRAELGRTQFREEIIGQSQSVRSWLSTFGWWESFHLLAKSAASQHACTRSSTSARAEGDGAVRRAATSNCCRI
jgi:hypothetical protein